MSIELLTIQPSHPLLPPSPPTLNLSQHQRLFQWVSSSHHVAQMSGFSSSHLAPYFEFLSLGFSRAQTLLAVQSSSSFWWPGAMFAPGKLWSHWNEVHSILLFLGLGFSPENDGGDGTNLFPPLTKFYDSGFRQGRGSEASRTVQSILVQLRTA